jgi:hypothetical protein
MIRERCSCGAEIETDEQEAYSIVAEWREEHSCKMALEPTQTSGFATVDLAPDYTNPELHIGFRYNEEDDET